MSRSSTDALAIGLGTCDIAVCESRREWPKWGPKWAACEHAVRAFFRAAASRVAPVAAVRDASEQHVLVQDSPVQDTLALSMLARDIPSREEAHASAAAPHRMVEIETARCYTEQGALDTLGLALADTDAAGLSKRRATVVLDDFWGRHAILNGDFRALRGKEIEEVAAAYFADTFGVDGETLSVRWQVQPGGRTLFASALPQSVIEGIRVAGDTGGVEITSITLALPQVLNRVRSAIAGRSGWLLVVTGTLLHAVTISNRGWSAYDTERLFHGGSDDAALVADAARQMFERSTVSRQGEVDVYLCGLALDTAPFERSFARLRALPAHMSGAAPALRLAELGS